MVRGDIHQSLEDLNTGNNSNMERDRENDQHYEMIPSLENPTKEFLLNNYKKVELQKRCRHLGLNNIWQTKEKLVNMIMNTHQSTRDEEDSGDYPRQTDMSFQRRIISELEALKEKLTIKDSEIRELNEMLKTAHVTINRLNDRITTLEEQQMRRRLSTTNQETTEEDPRERTLLIGDENLSCVRPSDLGRECSVKTLKDTTMDLTRCWVNEKLNWSPAKCIIFCGKNDIMENDNINDILDNLGSLVFELTNKNENIELFACELVPDIDVEINNKIDSFNEKLQQWTTANGVELIKTNINFKLGSGEIDEICYDVNVATCPTLNRYGVVRLLKTINKKCKFLELNEHFMNRKNNMKVYESISDKFIERNLNPDRNTYHERRFQRTSLYPTVSRYNQENKKQRPNSAGRDFQRIRRNHPYVQTSKRQGCYNCGEHNHQQSNCRFDHRIRCNQCFRYGHKNRMCSQNNDF